MKKAARRGNGWRIENGEKEKTCGEIAHRTEVRCIERRMDVRAGYMGIADRIYKTIR